MKKYNVGDIITKIGEGFFWGVMIFIIASGIFVVIKGGLVAIPFLVFCCVVVGIWVFFLRIGNIKSC